MKKSPLPHFRRARTSPNRISRARRRKPRTLDQEVIAFLRGQPCAGATTLDVVLGLRPDFLEQSTAERLGFWQEVTSALAHLLVSDEAAYTPCSEELGFWKLTPRR